MQQSDDAQPTPAVHANPTQQGCWRKGLTVLGVAVGVPIAAVAALLIAMVFLMVVLPSTLNELISPSRTKGASEGLRAVYDGALSYYNAEHFDAEGRLLPSRFPQSTPLTPSRVPCGETVTARHTWEANPTWRALGFAISDPHKYAFQYDSAGVAGTATFTASAFGDLDCDGEYSTFVRFGTVRNGQVVGSFGLYIANELE